MNTDVIQSWKDRARKPRPAVILAHFDKYDEDGVTLSFYDLDEAERWLNIQLDGVARYREYLRADGC